MVVHDGSTYRFTYLYDQLRKFSRSEIANSVTRMDSYNSIPCKATLLAPVRVFHRSFLHNGTSYRTNSAIYIFMLCESLRVQPSEEVSVELLPFTRTQKKRTPWLVKRNLQKFGSLRFVLQNTFTQKFTEGNLCL